MACSETVTKTDDTKLIFWKYKLKTLRQRKIIVVTGSRAEYGLLRPVMKAMQKYPSIKVTVVASGMHLMREHGYTMHEIERDGFSIKHKVKICPMKSSLAGMANAIGAGVSQFSKIFNTEKTNILLILGDRIEAFAAAVAAAYMNVFIAHIHGGDKSHGIDESVRHAITKLAHFHFAATPKSANRIEKLGEPKRTIYLTGSPALDDIQRIPLRSKRSLLRKLRLRMNDSDAYFLFVQHPVTTQFNLIKEQIKESLNALAHFHVPTVCIYPNADAGGRQIIDAIKQFEKSNDFFKSFKNLNRHDYLSLLKHAKLLVGNSSSGMIDAASFKTPVINIGSRQANRERSSNVIDVKAKTSSIIKGISKVLTSRRFRQQLRRCQNIYGDGNAGKRIAKILAEVSLNPAILQKQIVY